MELGVKYKNFPLIKCKIHDNELGKLYYNLVYANYQKQKPIYRDRLKFTREYLLDLIEEANLYIDIPWDIKDLSLDHTTLMHKFIETLSFDDIPAELDDVIHDLHFGLHLLQDNQKPTRGGWLQIEWYNDSGFKYDNFIFERNLDVGSLKLQNPYVGHGPLQIYKENDSTNISQTCKFHDFVKPGINIATVTEENNISDQEIIEYFTRHDPAFVDHHGKDKIISFVGYPIIGSVVNKDVMIDLYDHKGMLELETITFS